MTIRLLLPVTLDLHPDKVASLERVSTGLVADVYEAECRRIWPTGSRSDGVHVWEEVESHELAGLLPTSQPRAEVRDHIVDNVRWQLHDYSRVGLDVTKDHDVLSIPRASLPRVVRALAALMTNEQRAELVSEFAEEHLRRMEKLGFEFTTKPKAGTHELAYRLESGPGIVSLPEKRESLAFLPEDLLCEDE